MTVRPIWIQDKCSACGTCADVCPPKAIQIEGEKIKIAYRKCIRCFYGSEICLEEGMGIGEGFLLKMLKRRKLG